jgi:hypothetical protein
VSPKSILVINSFIYLFVGIQSCNHSSSKSETETLKTVSTKFEFKSFSTENPFVKKDVHSSLSDWIEFKELNHLITNISKDNYQILEGSDDLMRELFSTLITKIPKNINTPSITARIKVTETLVYKLKSSYKNNFINFEKTKTSLIDSYLNIIFQINKTIEKKTQKY